MVKNPPCNAGNLKDAGLIPGWGRSPGEGNGNPLPVFLPGKSHGQRNLATVHGVTRVRHDLVTKSPLNSLVTSWLSKRTDLKPPFPAPYGLVYSDLQLISLQYHHSHAHAALQPHWTSLISLAVLYLSFLCDHWKIFFFYSARNPYPSIILP